MKPKGIRTLAECRKYISFRVFFRVGFSELKKIFFKKICMLKKVFVCLHRIQNTTIWISWLDYDFGWHKCLF